MASPRWRQSTGVIGRLKQAPYRFEFFQSVRLLENAATWSEGKFSAMPVAGYSPPSQEVVRFRAQTSLSFVGADVLEISTRFDEGAEADSASNNQWSMEVGFGGLIGSQGVMPYFLTELVHKEAKNKSGALKDFLDIFNHRNVSMFYQAWHKYQLPVNYERARRQNTRDPDLFSHALAAIAGLGTTEMRYRTAVPDEALIGMAGHLGRQQCSAAALKSMIQQYFGLAVEIEQFHGRWDELPGDVLTRLPSHEHPNGVNNCLGINSILGTHCFQAQNKFRVVIAPSDYGAYMDISPGSEKLEALKSFIQLSAGVELDFDISVAIPADEVAPLQLNSKAETKALLGWNSQMLRESQNKESLTITLSSDSYSPDEALPSA
ncbi:type VI secretion system baseplate subunit TssG [Microbulbifer aggregans]|uniref:type VI secretion system baseplate subunit TssG n=1 Tax=Microbulbifer aggregans TaxID=1769779 RepID=UPI001CFDFFDA|nr:type VI secretion system baseplate subunit TssG [Microbulbifer aggregans]